MGTRELPVENCKNLLKFSWFNLYISSQNHLTHEVSLVNLPLYIEFCFHSFTSINGLPQINNSNSYEFKDFITYFGI